MLCKKWPRGVPHSVVLVPLLFGTEALVLPGYRFLARLAPLNIWFLSGGVGGGGWGRKAYIRRTFR